MQAYCIESASSGQSQMYCSTLTLLFPGHAARPRVIQAKGCCRPQVHQSVGGTGSAAGIMLAAR
jgi:hypothetical protein